MAPALWGFVLIFAAPAMAGDFRLLVLDHAFVKWGEPVLGSGAEVTYAFANEEIVTPGARNCGHIVPFSALSESSHLPFADLQVEARKAFATWEKSSALRFREAKNSTHADIVIGIQASPRGLAFTNVAPVEPTAMARLARFASSWTGRDSAAGVSSIQSALICLNPLQHWKIGFDGDLKTYDVRYALTHEIGHAIGLDHPGVSGALMDFRYSEKFDGLQASDIAAVRRLYGPAP
jgi:predicted Zn-dependent protease